MPLFKKPIHLTRITLSQLVMMYHTTSESDFELLLQLLSKTVPFIKKLKDQQEDLLKLIEAERVRDA